MPSNVPGPVGPNRFYSPMDMQEACQTQKALIPRDVALATRSELRKGHARHA